VIGPPVHSGIVLILHDRELGLAQSFLRRALATDSAKPLLLRRGSG